MSDIAGETIVVDETGKGDFQVEVKAGTSPFLMDEPVQAGGLGSGPNPYDLLSAAIGTYALMTIRLSLIRQFEELPLKPFEFHGYHGNRRIYTFGYKYIFAGQEARPDASIPDYLKPLTEIASRISGEPGDAFAQLMVTEYAPGAGIGWHVDRPSYEDIVSASLLAPCTLRLRRKKGESWERRSAHTEPRSVYLLHGPVRTVWQHSIAPMDVLRYSVTLRTFRPGRGPSDE